MTAALDRQGSCALKCLPTFAGRVAGIGICIRIRFQSSDFQDKRVLALRGVRKRNRKPGRILLVVQRSPAEHAHRAHRTRRATLWQRTDRDVRSGALAHHNRVEILPLHGEVDVVLAFFLELRPRVCIVDRLAVGLEPLADRQKSILLILRNGSICLGRNIEQQRSVLADSIDQPANDGLEANWLSARRRIPNFHCRWACQPPTSLRECRPAGVPSKSRIDAMVLVFVPEGANAAFFVVNETSLPQLFARL